MTSTWSAKRRSSLTRSPRGVAFARRLGGVGDLRSIQRAWRRSTKAIRRVVDSQTPYRVFPPGLAREFDVSKSAEPGTSRGDPAVLMDSLVR